MGVRPFGWLERPVGRLTRGAGPSFSALSGPWAFIDCLRARLAKPTTIKIRLDSTADTGFFYVTKKNPRTKTEKLKLKYDPVVRGTLMSSSKAKLSKPSLRGASPRLQTVFGNSGAYRAA